MREGRATGCFLIEISEGLGLFWTLSFDDLQQVAIGVGFVFLALEFL